MIAGPMKIAEGFICLKTHVQTVAFLDILISWTTGHFALSGKRDGLHTFWIRKKDLPHLMFNTYQILGLAYYAEIKDMIKAGQPCQIGGSKSKSNKNRKCRQIKETI